MKKKLIGKRQKQIAFKENSGLDTLFIFLFIIIILHLAGAISQSIYAWGFNFWSLMNLSVAVGLLTLALVLGIPRISDAIGRGLSGLFAPPLDLFRKTPPVVNYVIVTLILLGLFYVFRSRALVYGDGYLVLEYHTGLDNPFDFSANFMKPLVVLFHRAAYKLLSGIIDTAPVNVLSMINVAGGVVAFWALYQITRFLGRDSYERRLLLVGVLTCGTVILFFGYIENYTWPLALGLWSLAYSFAYIKGVNGRGPAIVAGIIAVGFHFFCLPFLVVAVIAAWFGPGETVDNSKSKYVSHFNRIILILPFAIALVFQLVELPPYFVKLWPVTGHPYWFLSGQHLVDVFNEMILAAPVGFIIVIYFFLRGRKNKLTPEPVEQILISLSLMTFLITFWIDPKLGAARDWDLLSFVGFPLTLWGLYRFNRFYPGAAKRPGTTVILVIIILIGIVPNLVEKNDLHKAAVRLDKIMYEDIHYQLAYLNGERCVSWGYALEIKVGDRDRAQKYFQRRIKTEEGTATLNFGLGWMHFRSGNLESAYSCFIKSAKYDTANAELTANLATVCNLLDKTEEAIAYARKTVALNSENPANLTHAGIVFSKQGYFVEARRCFYRVLELAPNAYKHSVNLGLCYDDIDNYDSAYFYYQQGLALSPDTLNQNPQFLYKLAKAETALGKYEPALQHCLRANVLMPGKADITGLLERINKAIEEKR